MFLVKSVRHSVHKGRWEGLSHVAIAHDHYPLNLTVWGPPWDWLRPFPHSLAPAAAPIRLL